jgi:hypothetical protein
MNKFEYLKIEKAKLLKSIRDGGVSDEDYRRIKKSLLTSSDSAVAIENAIQGLSEEDEFALICRLMKTATHLTPLGQRQIILGNYLTPDFLARFQPGCSVFGFGRQDSAGFKCFIEVKSTHNRKFNIGGAHLRRLRNFADHFGLPLLFAVRFLQFEQNAFWIIVEDQSRKTSSLAVSVKGLFSGIRHILWDECWYTLLPDMHFKSIFDLNTEDLGVKHPGYGTQVEFQIIVDNQVRTFKGAEAVIYSAFFEAFHLTEVEAEKHGSLTNQVRVPQLLYCSMADMVYNFNRLPCDDKGQIIYDPSKLITELDPTLYDIDYIDKVAISLNKMGVLFFSGFVDKDEHMKKWRQYGGKG